MVNESVNHIMGCGGGEGGTDKKEEEGGKGRLVFDWTGLYRV